MPRGTITERLKITLQNILVHHSWLLEWSSHPYLERWIPVNLHATTENSSLSTLLDFIIKKTSSLSFSPSLASSYLFERCLRLGVTSTFSVCLPLDESLHVFPNCKSLWIKTSAKWLNVNLTININSIWMQWMGFCAVLCYIPSFKTNPKTPNIS